MTRDVTLSIVCDRFFFFQNIFWMNWPKCSGGDLTLSKFV